MKFYAAIYDTRDLVDDPRPVVDADPSISVRNYNAYFPGFEHYVYGDRWADVNVVTRIGHHLLETAEVSETLDFSTQLHGGFAQCTFTLGSQPDRVMYRFRGYLGCMVVVFDSIGRRVYEGRIVDVALNPRGVNVQATGYYASATYSLFEMLYMSWGSVENLLPNASFEHYSFTAYPDYGSVVFQLNVPGKNPANWGWGYITAADLNNITPLTRPVLYDYNTTSNGSSVGFVELIDSAGSPLDEDFSVGFRQPNHYHINGTPVTYCVFVAQLELANGLPYSFSVFLRNGINGSYLMDSIEKPKLYIGEGLVPEFMPNVHWHVPFDQGKLVDCDVTGGWSQFKVENHIFSAGLPGSIDWKAIAVLIPCYDWSVHTLLPPRLCMDAAILEQKETSSPVFFDGSGAGKTWQVGEIITDSAAMVQDWNQQQSFVTPVTYPVGREEFLDTKVRDVLERMLLYGFAVDDLRPVYAALWHNRMLHVFPEPAKDTSVPDWIISIQHSEDVSLSLSSLEVFNKIHASTDYRLTPAEDKMSQITYGVREAIVSNEIADTDAIEGMLKNMALDRYSTPRAVYTVSITDYVENALGTKVPPHQVRAGDLVLIKESDAASPFNGTITGQVTRGFMGYVVRTAYNAASHRLSIDFGTLDVEYETLMARLGLTGGVS